VSRVCAIIVTYNSADAIEACVAPLLDSDAHVIVVDNDSADGTAALVRERLPQVELIANEDNRGFPAAVNQGAARALSNSLLLVNPDCVVPADTVRALDAFLEEHPDVGLVGPRLREDDGSIQISAHPLGSFSTLLANRARRVFPRALSDRFGESYDVCLNATEPTDVGMMIAACVAIRPRPAREDRWARRGLFHVPRGHGALLAGAAGRLPRRVPPDRRGTPRRRRV